MLADWPEHHPSVLTLDLRNGLFQNRNRGARRLQRFWFRGRIRTGSYSFRKQVLGVDEAAARLPETLRGFLCTETVDVGALFAQPRGEPGEIAVGRHEAKAVEPSAVQEVHRVDDQRNVGGVLALGVGKLLIGVDGVLLQDVDP